MCNVVKMNFEKSKELYIKYKSYIEPKMCYNNVFSIVSRDFEVSSNIDSGKWAIAYGYFDSDIDRSLLFRHAFLTDENGDAIDVTFFAIKDTKDDADYYVVRLIESIDEYYNLLSSDRLNPSLYTVLSKEFGEFEMKMLGNGKVCIG